MRFNSPPGWPQPPAGWEPPEGWKPDPAWPPMPEGWQLWLPDATDEGDQPPSVVPGADLGEVPTQPSVPVPPDPSDMPGPETSQPDMPPQQADRKSVV